MIRSARRRVTFALITISFFGVGAVGEELDSVIYSAVSSPLDWWVINDTVMGGRSQSRWVAKTGEMGVFEGLLSLENNGGFTSVRSSTVAFGAAHDIVRLRVRGDGRTYRFVLRTDATGGGVSYQHSFQTKAGQWTDIDLSLKDFHARWRGRNVMGAPPLRADDVRSVGFLLADKTPGPFQLQVSEIRSLKRRL